MQTLGIKISELNLEKARLKVQDFLLLPGQYKIFTPNPEMVVKAQKDKYFREVLNSGDLNICDGFGLSLFTKVPRITGVDFLLEICKMAEEMDKSIYLIGTISDEIVLDAALNLQKQFPKLRFIGHSRGPDIKEKNEMRANSGLVVDLVEEQSAFKDINESSADILFVAFGMGKQEKWIHENLCRLPNVKVAMGVGGSLDYISGHVSRAPRLLRKIGLEWLYRLVHQPSRFFRIFNATVRFGWLALLGKNQEELKS